MNILKQFQVKPFRQETYLINGELRKWEGGFANIYSTISSTGAYASTLLGNVPTLGKQEALEVLHLATDAYSKGKGL